jgi:4-amino-4-deoxy-L-arabinose transferase-like glycosyltransferase
MSSAPISTSPRLWRDVLADLGRFWEGPAAADLYPEATARVERVGRVLLAAAMIWMGLVAFWGIAGPFPDGHFAATANIGTAAWNMLTYHLRYPVLWTAAHPGPGAADSTYMHHPLGVWWTAAVFIKIFGAHNWAIRLPAVISSTLCPLLVYRIGRAVWGPVEGGIGAVTYVSLPITLGFSNFHALEGPVIVGLLVATWGYVRYLQTYRERYAVASLLGYAWALNNDWPAYFWMFAFAGLLFVRAFLVPPRLSGALGYRAVGRYWAFLVGLTAASLMLIAYFTIDSGKLQDLFAAYTNRSNGNQLPLRKVLEARHVWIELMFPGLAIFLGKLGLVVVLARAALRRSWNELMVPLPLFVMAGIQYAYFKQGADVHIFWPQYFAPYLALAMAALAASLRALAAAAAPALAAWLERRDLGGRGAAAAARLGSLVPYAGALLLALPLALVWRDGASMVRLGRETGGRFNSPNIQSDVDKVIALRWYLARYPKMMPLGFHPGMTVHWGLAWEADNRPIVRGSGVGTKVAHASRLYMLDTALASTAELRDALANFKVTAVGGYWFLDRDAAPGLEGWSFAEREPSLAAWYFEGGTEPTRTVVPDPFVAWEWRNVLGGPTAPPNPAPTVLPRTPDQLRIAHNVALAAGDAAGAERLRNELRRRFDMPVTASWKNGTVLLGGIHDRGAQRRITLFFQAGTFAGRARFSVTAKVTKRAFLSTLALDEAAIEIAQPPTPPSDLWRPGHIYAVRVPYFKRPGTERYTGRFVAIDRAPAPARADAGGDVPLLTAR